MVFSAMQSCRRNKYIRAVFFDCRIASDTDDSDINKTIKLIVDVVTTICLALKLCINNTCERQCRKNSASVFCSRLEYN